MAKRKKYELTAEEEARIKERVQEELRKEAEEEAKLREEFLNERFYTLDGKALPSNAEYIEQEVAKYRYQLTEAQFRNWKEMKELNRRLEARENGKDWLEL